MCRSARRSPTGPPPRLTDFRIHADGFSRHLLLDHATTPWQAGRVVQRLLEIDTYRIMALLALPVARAVGPLLSASERELAQITASLVTAEGSLRTGAAQQPDPAWRRRSSTRNRKPDIVSVPQMLTTN